MERRDAGLSFWIVGSGAHENANAPHPLGRLLRVRRERLRCCRAAEQRDELASSQLIELHPVPASQGRITGYRIASDQSAGSWEARREAIAPAEVWAGRSRVKDVPAEFDENAPIRLSRGRKNRQGTAHLQRLIRRVLINPLL